MPIRIVAEAKSASFAIFWAEPDEGTCVMERQTILFAVRTASRR